MWASGYLAGTEMPQVSDACANAYGNYMCSNILPNCTYMPWARWPYQEQFEKIYVCKEICEEVRKYCDISWIPHEMRWVRQGGGGKGGLGGAGWRGEKESKRKERKRMRARAREGGREGEGGNGGRESLLEIDQEKDRDRQSTCLYLER